MNGFQDAIAVEHRRASTSELQVKLAAIRAFETCGDCALERMTAPVAKWRLDELHLLSAVGANKGLAGRGAGIGTNLADLRIDKSQPGVDPGLRGIKNSIHPAFRILIGTPRTKQNFCATCVNMNTPGEQTSGVRARHVIHRIGA